MDPDAARSTLEDRLRHVVEHERDLHTAQLLVHSDKRDLHWKMAHGESGGTSATPEQPYHVASVGKTFTATIIALLADSGELAFDDPIEKYLSQDLLDGLHVYRGTDYSADIRICHLLGHTSGLPHFHGEEYGIFGRKKEQSPDGQTLFDVMLAEPGRFWEPVETINWTKTHLQPHFAPGDGVYYSETGYNLLGLIIEAATGQSYHEVLHESLFEPLGMTHSYLSQYSDPTVESELPVADFYIDDTAFEVESYRSFSAWYAGGQTVNTLEDLLVFHRSLVAGDLLRDETLGKLMQWNTLYMGLDYGYGVVRLRPLPFLRKYRAWGGLGATSSFMFYNPAWDVHLIGTFNQWNYMRQCMRFLFRTLRTISKVPARDEQ